MGINQDRRQVPHYGSIKNLLKNKESEKNLEKFNAKPANPWEYDFKYECPNNGKTDNKPDPNKYWNLDQELDPIKRLLKYKNNDDDFDCDGSGKGYCNLSREIYKVLWNWQPEAKSSSYGFLGVGGWLAGPDTMNSYFTSFNHYLNIKTNYSIKKLKEIYNKVAENSYRIEELIPDESIRKMWQEFAKLYHYIGNFVLVQAGFNTHRSNQCND